MDPNLVTAASAIVGSLVGGMASLLTTYVGQRYQSRRERFSKELERREELYAGFNQLASELLLDSLNHSLDEPAKLTGIMTAVGRIRLTSSAAVLHAAEQVISHLLASYTRDALDPRDVIAKPFEDWVKPLMVFTQACRDERESMIGRNY